jgi:hypothetical protein
MPVQLRYASELSSADYVSRKGWLKASLNGCPVHTSGDCAFARHGTYERVHPPGTRIARWYCPQAHCSFSLLPDHLAARFPATLPEIEQVVAVVEGAPSLEAAADRLRRDDVSLTSAVRWTRRRVRLVHTLLAVLVTVLPDLLLGCAPTLYAFRVRLACEEVLVGLRETAQAHLGTLHRPLGFQPPQGVRGERTTAFQQHTGRDPPAQRP